MILIYRVSKIYRLSKIGVLEYHDTNVRYNYSNGAAVRLTERKEEHLYN